MDWKRYWQYKVHNEIVSLRVVICHIQSEIIFHVNTNSYTAWLGAVDGIPFGIENPPPPSVGKVWEW